MQCNGPGATIAFPANLLSARHYAPYTETLKLTQPSRAGNEQSGRTAAGAVTAAHLVHVAPEQLVVALQPLNELLWWYNACFLL